MTNYDDFDVIVVGCGLSGMTIAEQFSQKLNKKVLIVEKRHHLGGTCYDFVDEDTGIRMNAFGAHLFRTNDEMIYNYVKKYSNWVRWEHQVLGLVDDQYVCIPANITTVNKLCGENIKTVEEMDEWLEARQIKYDEITNSEEMAKSRVGEVLYEKIFKHYTYKQWNRYPNELKPEVLARIPLRNNFDTRYFSDRYQMLPEHGYTNYFEQVVNHNPNIKVTLNTDFFDVQQHLKDQIIIYTGPIDRYFSKAGLPPLEYRSIDFEVTKVMNCGYYQPNSVVNYPSKTPKYTRCVEYKHFLNQKSKHTVIVKESSTDSGEPYYPVPNKRNLDLYEEYRKLSSDNKRIHFLGRLASYKYFSMDQAIKNALQYFQDHFESKEN